MQVIRRTLSLGRGTPGEPGRKGCQFRWTLEEHHSGGEQQPSCICRPGQFLDHRADPPVVCQVALAKAVGVGSTAAHAEAHD